MNIKVGQIVRPQGIKGELKVRMLSVSQFFEKGKLLYIDDQQYKIVSSRANGDFAVIKLDNVNDCNMAESMRDKLVYADKASVVLPNNQYFYDDLIGCMLVDEQEQRLGEIVDIENYGASDILHIKSKEDTTQCPFVNGLFVHVDVQNKKIQVSTQKYLELTNYED